MQALSDDTMRLLDIALWRSAKLRYTSDSVRSVIHANRTHYEGFDARLANSFQGVVARGGVHRLQQLIYETGAGLEAMVDGARNLPHVPLPSWQVIAEIEALGQLNLMVAEQLMPQALLDAAEQWHGADAERQIELCQIVYEALSVAPSDEELEQLETKLAEESSVPYWMEDYENQPLGRIFPLAFLKQGKHKANCTGKGILLTAFFRKVGARHYGVTPLRTAGEEVQPTLLRMGDFVREFAEEHKITLPQRLLDRLELRRAAEEAVIAAPSRFHMGVMVQLADDSWYYVDPHMSSAGRCTSPETGVTAKFIDNLCPVVPGICLLMNETLGMDPLMQEASFALGDVADLAKSIQQQWKKVDCDPLAVLPLLATSPALEILVDEHVFIDKERVELYHSFLQGEQIARFVVKTKGNEEGATFNFHTTSGRELTPTERSRLNVASEFIGIASRGELVGPSGYSNAAMTEGLERILGILMSISYRRAAKVLGQSRSVPGMVHPIVEVYEPRFRIGVELLAHINAITTASNDVVMDLAYLCGGQHHQLLAATEPLRTGEEQMSDTALSAVKALQAVPYRLPVVEEGFSRLREAGVLQPEREMAHGA